jgi:hypothetical protein
MDDFGPRRQIQNIKRASNNYNAVIKKFKEQEEATLRVLVVKSGGQSVIRLVDARTSMVTQMVKSTWKMP